MEKPKYFSEKRAEDIAHKMKKEVEEDKAQNYEGAVENVAKIEISGIAQRNKEIREEVITTEKILKLLEKTEDLKDLVEKENKAVFFLRGMLNLENFYLEQKRDDKSELPIKNYNTDNVYFEKAFEDFSKIVEQDEEFIIKVKNKKEQEDGTYKIVDVTYGDLSLANAYLGDLHIMKYYTEDSKNEDDWQKVDELYKKAVDLENVGGLKHEAKAMIIFRRLAHYLGKEDLFYALKTVRRIDLQNPAADIVMEYVNPDDSKNVKSALIDITAKERKDGKNKNVYVLSVSYEEIDYIAGLDFTQPPFVQVKDAGSLRKDRTKPIFKRCLSFVSKFSKAFNIKEKDRDILKANFFIEKDKYKKYFPAMSEQFISQYRGGVEAGVITAENI